MLLKPPERDARNHDSSKLKMYRYWGGFTNLLDQGEIKDWMPTVMENPWLFRGNLMPIHELITDGTKKKEMKLAVQVHLDKAYLTVSWLSKSKAFFTISITTTVPLPMTTVLFTCLDEKKIF